MNFDNDKQRLNNDQSERSQEEDFGFNVVISSDFSLFLDVYGSYK